MIIEVEESMMEQFLFQCKKMRLTPQIIDGRVILQEITTLEAYQLGSFHQQLIFTQTASKNRQTQSSEL